MPHFLCSQASKPLSFGSPLNVRNPIPTAVVSQLLVPLLNSLVAFGCPLVQRALLLLVAPLFKQPCGRVCGVVSVGR